MMKSAHLAVMLAVAVCAACDSGSGTKLESPPAPVPPEFAAFDPARCPPSDPFDGHGFEPAFVMPSAGDPLAARIFPMLAMLEGDAATRAAIDSDAVLARMSAAARDGLNRAQACAGESTCVASAVSFSAEADAVARSRLVALFGDASSDLVARNMLPSGAFMRWAAQPAPDVVGAAWDDATAHLDELATSYLLALSPERLAPLVADVNASLPHDAPWFAPLESLVITGMRLDGRDEAARYEPLDSQENAAAIARMPTIRWDAWRFAAIVVPGQGPTDPTTELTPLGAQRSDLAVERWKAGLAPFIFTSGGHVHPDRTAFSEAIEMKRYLMDKHGVPEDAILVDPYARHTTTNIRNTTRTLLTLGVPVDSAVLVTSDIGQSFYIAALLAPRCRRELGYVPWRGGAFLGSNDSCLRPSPDVLFVDASDELDP